MGHVHFKVASIPESVGFYRDVLGLELMAQLGAQAAFLAAGGYHHHVGANTWESAGGSAPPPGSAPLLHATIVLPDAAEQGHVIGRIEHAGLAVDERDGAPFVADPSGNLLALATAT
jgi:catechol 2,3-dioxygenase